MQITNTTFLIFLFTIIIPTQSYAISPLIGVVIAGSMVIAPVVTLILGSLYLLIQKGGSWLLLLNWLRVQGSRSPFVKRVTIGFSVALGFITTILMLVVLQEQPGLSKLNITKPYLLIDLQTIGAHKKWSLFNARHVYIDERNLYHSPDESEVIYNINSIISTFLEKHPTGSILFYCNLGFRSHILSSADFAFDYQSQNSSTLMMRAQGILDIFSEKTIISHQLARAWVEQGHIKEVHVDQEMLESQSSLEELKRKLENSTERVLISLRGDISYDEFEEALYGLTGARLVYAQGQSNYRANWARFSHQLSQRVGGIWNVIIAILILQFLIYLAALFKRSRASYVGSKSSYNVWRSVELGSWLGSMYLIESISSYSYEFYRLAIFEKGSVFSNPQLFIALLCFLSAAMFIHAFLFKGVEAFPLSSIPLKSLFHLKLSSGRIFGYMFGLFVLLFCFVLGVLNIATSMFILFSLYVPLIIAGLLSLGSPWLHRNQKKYLQALGEKITVSSAREATYSISSYVEEYPGQYLLKIAQEQYYCGMFSKELTHTQAGSALVSSETLQQLCQKLARARRALGYDIRLTWNSKLELESVERIDQKSSLFAELHDVLCELAITEATREKLNQVQWNRSTFEESFKSFRPLEYEMFAKRNADLGSASQALQFFKQYQQSQPAALLYISDQLFQRQNINVAKTTKLRSFLARWNTWVTNRTVDSFCRLNTLYLDGAVLKQHQKRLEYLRNLKFSPQEDRVQLLKDTYQIIKQQWTKASLWQEFILFAYQNIYYRLEKQRKLTSEKDSLPSLQALKLQTCFERLSYQRQKAQEIYQQEEKAVFEYLDSLDQKLKLEGTVFFLETQDLRESFLKNPIGLKKKAQLRKEAWKLEQQALLPMELSLLDLESISVSSKISLPAAKQTQQVSRVHWVVPPIDALVGVVASTQDSVLHAHSVVIDPLLRPKQWTLLKHTAGVIMEQGSVLSHFAILAREAQLPLMIQAPKEISQLPPGDIIRLEHEGTYVSQSPSANSYLPLTAVTDASWGNKAVYLGQCLQLGLVVPFGVVLAPSLFTEVCKQLNLSFPRLDQREQLPDALLQSQLPESLLKKLKELYELVKVKSFPVIVRSSAPLEDLNANHSMAGLWESKGSVQSFEELVQAICLCWGHAWGLEVASLQTQHFDAVVSEFSLIIQYEVRGDCGGVLFTKAPDNSSQMYVELSSKGPQAITAGESPEFALHLPRDINATTEHLPLPKNLESLLIALPQAGIILEQHFGAPQDIEWVWKDQKLIILQTRNIKENDSSS